MKIGVLALQGDYQAHEHLLLACAAGPVQVVAVREPADLEGLSGLVIPGGESTTMSRLCDRYGLWEPLKAHLAAGMGAFGTCAGLILLAGNISGATRNFEQKTLGALDIDVARNAYGAQIDSFEADVEAAGPLAPGPSGAPPLHAVFIRAPRIARCGEVEVLARYQGEPVAVRHGRIMAATFHPEIAGEIRLHRLWLKSLEEAPPPPAAVPPNAHRGEEPA
jgi:5'-phosphate synthase pdxT subunit